MQGGASRETQDAQKLWGLHSSDAAVKGRVSKGTVLGMSYDQSSGPPTVHFFIDGKQQFECAIQSIKGLVVPAVGVTGSASVTCNFGHKFAKPPEGSTAEFSGVMLAGKMM